MSFSYLAATKNNRLSVTFLAGAVTPAAGQSVDAGASFGQLVILTSALAVLATFTLQKPSVSIAGGVATILGVPLTCTATASGTAAVAQLRDSAGNVIAGGATVGIAGSGADVIINAVAISSGQQLTLTSGTDTAT